MTHTARLTATEQECLALVEAASEEPALAANAADVAELAPGKWQALFYFAAKPGREDVAALTRIARAVLGAKAGGFAVEALPETDWVAKSLEGLAPVRAGRFLVHGGHDRVRVRENDIGIEIEAGEAFGTGHHGTTAGCLLAIDRLAKTRAIRNALDVGTGSGVLAIAIARLTKAPVLASDIDPVATRVARENIAKNGTAATVIAFTATGLADRRIRTNAPYDLIVANILAGPLQALAPAIRRAIAPGGTVILSGLLPEQRARIVSAYRRQGLRLRRWTVLDDWLTLTLERPNLPARPRV
ncbi:MAG TPA: 50S ribosomal protein L11 methyltransferase [Bauldia sp.]|nr:50S ribosomal protein L11 methyltransferase [Bauldia sp.]